MTTSTATVQTTNASRYLQQLCKHFGHKVPVEFTPKAGTVRLPFGTCTLTATADHLTLINEGQDLPRMEQFIGDHLMRFAFRENLTLAWQHAAA